jgi:hypothetical protein
VNFSWELNNTDRDASVSYDYELYKGTVKHLSDSFDSSTTSKRFEISSVAVSDIYINLQTSIAIQSGFDFVKSNTIESGESY